MSKIKKAKDAHLKRTVRVLSGFRDFALRGNSIEIAVGVVIGAAFSAIVKALVDAVITPLIAAFFGRPDLTDMWIININGSSIQFGVFATAVINFLIIAAALYFFIILPLNKLLAFSSRNKDEATEEVDNVVVQTELLRDIKQLLEKK
jgi:large conductance mechanosensitive channel